MLGDSSHGKITADEWNTVLKVVFPLLLVPLWGYDSAGDEPTRERKLLDNFVNLVVSVKLAATHEVTECLITELEAHYQAYLKGLQELFPHRPLKPNHHMFTHIGQFLRDFGPIRSWSAWAFERLNGLAQKVPTNKKIGDQFI